MTPRRRRGDELVRAIHEAVRAEVAEHGYAGTTYDGVAARAGTSKPVLYRRWPTKAGMVLDASLEANPGLTLPPDTGSLSGDLKAFLRTAQSLMERAGRQTLLSLLAELDRTSGESIRDLLVARGAEVIEPLLDRARARGELGDAPIPPRVVTLALTLVRHEVVIVGALTEETLDAIVDEIAVPLLTAHDLGHDPRV
ncbi:DNA-binding transcriptional regulator, AcrR family [Asanoa hainanensis]|uniref:DNA-binding transcriptional regulator, AcrR family n=1 Tax=Asanoa hainanensis TaxID=560556 RepID=A0A239NMW4_9ACTN|nr:TetR/AcrR family transcriptional regulator [Asanoa hainanensis]SNT55718.1 DNA-binding transcriptional regulator, AcrR family [Asanoa hainanensis]